MTDPTTRPVDLIPEGARREGAYARELRELVCRMRDDAELDDAGRLMLADILAASSTVLRTITVKPEQPQAGCREDHTWHRP